MSGTDCVFRDIRQDVVLSVAFDNDDLIVAIRIRRIATSVDSGARVPKALTVRDPREARPAGRRLRPLLCVCPA